MTKGLIVLTLDVGMMSPAKAEAFLARMTENITKNKPEGWNFMGLPVRYKGSKIQVFAVDEDEGILEEVKPCVVQANNLIKECKAETAEKIRDHVKSMIGAPVLKLSDKVINYIDVCIDRAFHYDVNNKQRFVLEEVEHVIVATEDIVDIMWDGDEEDDEEEEDIFDDDK